MRLLPVSVALALSIALASCQDTSNRMAARHNIPINPQLMALMSEKGMHPNSPVLIRSFKKESELEIWKKGRSGRYELLKTYPICRWSGQLGPKKREGDRQAPEGFYHITPAHMNPNSSFYLSFNMGFPNAFDRQHGRSGAHLMVHGACSSSGCYSMSDDQIAEIYALVREAHNGGQRAVQMQAMPFRMTPENLARHRYDANIAFWRNLKEGSDIFEVARLEPRVSVCSQRYAFNRNESCGEDSSMQDVAAAAADKRRQDDAKVAELVRQGTPAVRLVYQDGGQHAKFTQVLMTQGPEALEQHASWGSRAVGVSRPDAIIAGPREVAAAPGPSSRTAAEPRAQIASTREAQPAAAGVAASAARRTTQPVAADAAPQQAQQPQEPATGGGFWQAVTSFNPFAAPAPAAQPQPAPTPTRAPLPPRRAEGATERPPSRASSPQASAPQQSRTAALRQD